MMALQTTIRGILGLMVGMAAGAMLGGVLAAIGSGAMWVLSGMVLGAMAGSIFGAGMGLWRGIYGQPARQVVYRGQRAQEHRLHVAMGGD